MTAAVLSNSFPPLLAFANDRIAKMKAMDVQQHAHVPYPVLLIRALQEWKAAKGSDLPANFAEKEEFKTLIKGMARSFHDELNFAEAVDNAYTAYVPPVAVPDDVADLLTLPSATNVTAASPPFFLLLHTLKKYLEQHKLPPINGSIPDMTSLTDDYVELQTIYHTQAQEVSFLID